MSESSRGQREVRSFSTMLRSRADLLSIHRSTVDLMALEKVAQGWPLLLRPGEGLTEVPLSPGCLGKENSLF